MFVPQVGEARLEQGGLRLHHEEPAGARGRGGDRRDVPVRRQEQRWQALLRRV